MLIAHGRTHVGEDVLRVSDGFAWLAQAGMFLVLGIITEVTNLLPAALPALLIALVLMLVARPLAIAGCLLPFRYPAREIAFIGWIGMRGAVPIVLGLFPLLAGIPQAQLLFHIAFFTVLLSLLFQGGTLPLAARWAKVVAGQSRSAIATVPLDGGESVREVVQFEVADGAPATRRAVQDVNWPVGSRMVEVLRRGAHRRVQHVTGRRSGGRRRAHRSGWCTRGTVRPGGCGGRVDARCLARHWAISVTSTVPSCRPGLRPQPRSLNMPSACCAGARRAET